MNKTNMTRLATDAAATSLRHARMEAQAVLGSGLIARVLEPSPPAIHDDVWYADDPTGPAAQRNVVAPVTGRGFTWDEWLADHQEHRAWASRRWLGAYRRLPAPPPGFESTRLSLHRLALYVMSPARRRANGKIGLRWTYEGFGTPFFGTDEQVRVVGDHLVRQDRAQVNVQRITTLSAAAATVLAGPPDVAWTQRPDIPSPGQPDDALTVDPIAAAFLAHWFGFAFSVLEQLRAESTATDVSRVQLWPEGFDAAFDFDVDGGRAVFGASPGDRHVPEPYLYVLPGRRVRASAAWNATSFAGASLPLSGFVDVTNQRAAALGFFRGHRALLHP